MASIHERGKVVFQLRVRGQYRENILVAAVQKLDGMGKRAILPVLIDFEIPDNAGKQNDR